MNVSTVYLKRGDAGELVEASLADEVTDAHISLWDKTWSPMMQAHSANKKLSDKPEDRHWDWREKAGWWRPLLGYHSFALLCRNELQGMMLASDFKSARLQTHFGKPVVYIEFLATAPWNRPEFQKPTRYRGVGTVMPESSDKVAFVDTRIALGAFVSLWRRNQGWDAARLAEKAGLEPQEILEIEHDPHCEPEPDAVRKLAKVFGLPAKPLLELAGLSQPQTAALREEAVRFAARSESVAELNQHERDAFEVFVSAIARSASRKK
jgi:HTH-type transcriptional regulator, competence development regulator